MTKYVESISNHFLQVKPREVKIKAKEVELKADYELFGKMVLIGGSRNLDMANVLRYPLGPIPWSLSTPTGSFKNTNKALLTRHLEKKSKVVEAADELNSPSASIIDGMILFIE